MSRQRRCAPEDSDVSCRGESVQRQQCYSTACPGKQHQNFHVITWCHHWWSMSTEITLRYCIWCWGITWCLCFCRAVDGYWLPWVTWSNCSAGCGGVEVRQRECFPPQNGGRTCVELPGETNLTTDISENQHTPQIHMWSTYTQINTCIYTHIWSWRTLSLLVCSEPCDQDGCVNVSCPAGLVRRTCASCPLTCAHVSRATSCDPDSKCFTGGLIQLIYKKIWMWSGRDCRDDDVFLSGCWCADGRVMNHERQCVLPDECVCEVSGVRYWPGQQVKVGCDICVCERGRAQRCQPNPECSGNITSTCSIWVEFKTELWKVLIAL